MLGRLAEVASLASRPVKIPSRPRVAATGFPPCIDLRACAIRALGVADDCFRRFHFGPRRERRPDNGRRRHPALSPRSPRRFSRRPAPADRRYPLAHRRARRRSLTGRTAQPAPGARPLLDERLRLAQMRGPVERAPAVPDRDRRRRHPLHPRALASRRRIAGDHHPRVARLGHRDARGHRAADGPDGARGHRRRRLRRGDPIDSRVRLLVRADRARLVRGARRAGVAEADGAPRLQAVRGPGRRPGRLRHRRDGPPGAARAPRHPHQPARPGAGEHSRLPDGHRRGARGRRLR